MEDGVLNFIGLDGEKYRAHIRDGKLCQITQRVFKKDPRPYLSWWMNKIIWHPGAHNGKLSNKACSILPVELRAIAPEPAKVWRHE